MHYVFECSGIYTTWHNWTAYLQLYRNVLYKFYLVRYAYNLTCQCQFWGYTWYELVLTQLVRPRRKWLHIEYNTVRQNFKVTSSISYFYCHHEIPVSTTQREWPNWFTLTSLYDVVKYFCSDYVDRFNVDSDSCPNNRHFVFRCHCVYFEVCGVCTTTEVHTLILFVFHVLPGITRALWHVDLSVSILQLNLVRIGENQQPTIYGNNENNWLHTNWWRNFSVLWTVVGDICHFRSCVLAFFILRCILAATVIRQCLVKVWY